MVTQKFVLPPMILDNDVSVVTSAHETVMSRLLYVNMCTERSDSAVSVMSPFDV